MTDFMRRVLALVIVLAAVLHGAAVTGSVVSAQAPLNGAACWPQGALTGVSGGSMTWSQPPATIIDPTQQYQASIDTTAGNILIQLDPSGAPVATNNFICLSLAGYYTGTDFHRIFAGYLIQGGDPSGTGVGNPGYSIASDPTLGPYPIGAVAMANAVPNQNGSQFFIAADDLTAVIPANYPVFGQVIGGMDVVQAISQGAVQAQVDGEQSKPIDPVMVLNVTIQSAAGASTGVGPVIGTATQPATQPTQEPPATIAPTTAAGGFGRPQFATTTTTPVAVATMTPVPPATNTPVIAAPTMTPVTGTAGGETAGCTGFEAYKAAFDDAYTSAAIANPEALAFLLAAQNNPEVESIFDDISADDATALSGFYLSLADALAAITAPAFATEWHGIQIEIFRALSEFTSNVATQGMMFASMQAATAMGDLADRSDAAVIAATAACGEFAAWANGEPSE